MEVKICYDCGQGCDLPCAAYNMLAKVYTDLRTEEKKALIREIRSELELVDYEVADDLKDIAEKVISAMPEVQIIREYNIKVGYVRSYEGKQNKGKAVFADCKKINGTYTAFLPYDFVITFYDPNTYHMSENQKKILMLHELKHIGIGEKGFRIENHDVEDFKDILYRYGIDWNGYEQDVPDILAGGESGKCT